MSFLKKNFTYNEMSFERDFNLLYIEVNPTIRTGITRSKKEVQSHRTSNLAIYHIAKDQLTYFFPEGSINNIVHIFYEERYNLSTKTMNYHKEVHLIYNNHDIPERKPADKLFVITEDETTEELELWISSKSGTDKKMVKKFTSKTKWKFDVFNRKIHFVQAGENNVKVEVIDW